MRLFVFEGEADERVFKTLKHLFLNNEDEVLCVYHCNIYSLYQRLEKYQVFSDELPEDQTELDTASILNEILLEKGDSTIDEYVKKGEIFAEIFLFFDYDLHHENSYTEEEKNSNLVKMLNFFADENENGKLYISYPMLEAYMYIKDIPDPDFVNYTITKDDCINFKCLATDFSKISVDHFSLTDKEWEDEIKREKRLPKIKGNWLGIIPMNVAKANFICTGDNKLPEKKAEVSQQSIFENQVRKYVVQEPCMISILGSFPLFLFEYLKPEVIGLKQA